MSKGHDSRAVANFFVDLAAKDPRQLAILPLVKFVYLAHGWTLGYTDKPLIRDPIEAWRLGPVIPKVYFTFRPQGIVIKSHAVDWKKQRIKDDFEKDEESIMKSVYNHHSTMDFKVLTALTHMKGTPWAKYANTPNAVIEDEAIKKYYKNMIESREK